MYGASAPMAMTTGASPSSVIREPATMRRRGGTARASRRGAIRVEPVTIAASMGNNGMPHWSVGLAVP